VVVQPDSRILVAGDFASVDGFPANGIARLNPDGTFDEVFDTGTGANAPVHSLALANVTSTFVIPRQATGTELEDRFTVDTGANAGTIFISYDFLSIPDNIRVYYDGVRIFDLTTNGTGNLVIPYGPGASTFVTVVMNEGTGTIGTAWLYTLTIQTGARLDNRIAAGGAFNQFNGQPRGRVTILNSTGSLYPVFDPRTISTRSVYALDINTNTALPDLVGKIMAGGDFTAIVGVNGQNRLARLNIDGTLDRTFRSGLGFNNTVRAVAVQADGKTIAGGLFTSYDLISRSYFARLNADGSVDNTFNFANNGGNINNPVNALVLQPDGKIMIGGAFTTVYGAARNGIARMNTNGTVDATFNPGTGANGAINAVAVQADGKVLIGGDFTTVNGVSKPHIARLNANGSVDGTFTVGTGANGSVNAIVVQADGSIVIGGLFTGVNGSSLSRIARLTSSGAVDPSFNPGTGANDYVSSLRLQPDGSLLVGGNFTSFNGQVRNHIARLNSDGSLDPTINFGAGANDLIAAIALQNYDGKIVVGGSFTEFDGITRVAIARLLAGTNSGSGSFHFSAPAFVTNERSNAVITVVRGGGTQGSASVNYSTANGTATAPADYTAVSGTLVFNDAESVKQFVVPVIDNSLVTGDRAFNVTLSNPSAGASISAPSNAVVTIEDNDSVIGFSSVSYVASEAAALARITVVRTGGAIDAATVDFATGDTGTATPGLDFTAVSGTLFFAPGVRVRTFDVPIIDDTIAEFDETVPLLLSRPTAPSGGAHLGISNATLTIVENDFSPGTITFGTANYFTSEDSGGITIELLRTNGHSGSVSVNFQTLGTGTATPNVDYVATNALVTFIDGQTNAFITVYPIDDTLAEGNETVPLQLSAPSGGAGLGLANATLTIVDNDAPGQFVFSAPSYTVSESNAFATITVLRTNGNKGAVSVTVQNSGGTATPGVDYGAVNTVLSFADGQTARTLTVPIFEDSIVEGTETVFFILSNPQPPGGSPTGPSIGTPNPATLFIVDDEVSVGFAAASLSALESPTNVPVSIIRTGDTNAGFSVFFSTSDGSATAGADYVASASTVTFAPGQTTQTVFVTVLDDALAEGDETVNLTLSSASGGVALGPIGSAVLTIQDNDVGFNFSSANYATNENSGFIAITVIRSGFTNAAVSVAYSTADGSATAGLDYVAATNVLNFAAGQTSQVFNVNILDDLLVEGNETVLLTLSNPQVSTNAALPGGGAIFLGPQSTAVFTILDDDTTVGFSPTSYIVNEKAGVAAITIVRNGSASQAVSVGFRTQNGSATAGADYTFTTQNVVWAANDISPKTVFVPILDDSIPEGAETVNLILSNPVGATLDPNAATGVLTIVDNAGVIAFASASYSAVENSGNALLNLVRTGGSNGVVSVQWNVTGGTATPGADYSGTQGTVVFANGETVKPIILPIVDDALQEGIETVNLALSNAGGGSRIGSPSTAVLSILDDDAGIIVGAGSALIAESFSPTNNIIEPGETVTLMLALRNVGVVDAVNVTAGLVYANGVTNSSGPQTQNYGTLLAGGDSASRPFTFTAIGTNGTRITATLLITNNGLFLGPVSFDFVLGVQTVPFQNATAIVIPDVGPATNNGNYPATLTVSGVSGPLTKLTVTLNGLTHTYPDDLDILLVSPNGTAVMLMSDAGGGNAVNNVTITFDEAAAFPVPDSLRLTNGMSYQVMNYPPLTDTIPPFAPGSGFWTNNTSLAAFNGVSPNGVWSLYVVDDSSSDHGTIAGGWSMNISATDTVIPGADLSVSIDDTPDPVRTNGVVNYTITVVNHGPAAATGVVLTNVLPAGATFITVSGPGNYTLNGNVLIGNLGNIAMNASAVVTVTMRAPGVSTQLTFDSTVAAGTADLNPNNNHASIKTSVTEGTAAVPTLFAARKNGQLVLSWQGTSTNIVLQSASALNAGSWGDATNTTVISNGATTVTAPMNGGLKFYRLKRVP